MQETHEAQASTSASSQPTGPHGQQPKAGPSSVGAWLTQSLAAIKRRGRSTDDGQSLAILPANGSINEQHQVLVDSLVSQAAPAASTRPDTPAAVPVTAQHAEQAVKVKRKPGRPRKVPPKPAPPASTVTHPLSTPAAGTSIVQLTYGPHLPSGVVHLPEAQLALSPPASAPLSSAADAVPAGALMPHRRSSSVQIDMSKLLKSRTKAQLPSSKSSGIGTTTPAQRAVTGAIVPEGTTVMPTMEPPNSIVVQSPAAAAAAADLAVAPAAEATGAEPMTVSEAGKEPALMASEAAPFTASQIAREAADVAVAIATLASAATVATARAPKSVPQAEAAAVVSEPAPITGSEGGMEAAAAADKPVTPVDLTGSPAKQRGVSAAVRQQSAASSVTLSAPVSPTPPTATSGKKSAEAAKLAAAGLKAHSTADQTPVHESTDSLPPAATSAAAAAAAASSPGVLDGALPNLEPMHADTFSAAGQATSKEAPHETKAKPVKQTQQGPEEVLQTHSAMEDRSQSHNSELPLSILLNGGPVKKRGRPYKNAANAEKAAQRDARKAAQAAVEKAAYQAAGEAAQVVITAPPIKKRRGRPPKDPAKLAAALAAYHANAHARQVSTDQEQGSNPGFDTVMEAAQAAAAHASAAVAGPSAAVAGPAQQLSPPQTEVTVTASAPRSGQTKRGRPPKSIAKVLGDNLQSPSGSAADGDGHPAVRQETVSINAEDVAEDEDDDQALLDAAAVLTSDLPFPQGIRRQALPFQQSKRRQLKGRHRSGGHAKVQSKPTAAAQKQQRRRGLELVSSRATALLDSIGPDLNGPARDRVPSPQAHPGGSPQMHGDPLTGSLLEHAAPTVSGRPLKKQRKHHHSSQQPATAAAGSTGGSPQVTLAPAPSPPSSGLPEAVNVIAHTDDASAVAGPTVAVSSPGGHDAGGLPNPHATPMPTVPDSVAEELESYAPPSSVPNGSPIHVGPSEQTVDKVPQTLPEQAEQQVEQKQQQQQHNGTHITHQEADREAAPAADHAVGHPTAHMVLLQQQAKDGIPDGRDALAQGQSTLPKGKHTLPKGTDALSEGRQEPCGATSSGGIQPPVMLSHLANPKAAHFRDNDFRDSLKKTLDAGRELGQPSLQQTSSSLAHSAQPRSQVSDTALRSATAEMSRPAAEPSQQPDLDEPLHADSSSQPAHPLHTAEPSSQAAQQQQPAALQQPVLALLVSGLPPIVLGSFQGDMQRARIILEAAGFLVPLDISSSLLPPGLSQSLPQQQAVHAALHAEHAELSSDQTAAADKDTTRSADAAAGVQHPFDVQTASALEASVRGASLRGAHRRKQKRGSEQPVRFAKSAQAQQQPGADKPKRGRPSNVGRAAAVAAAATAAEAHGYSREGGPSPSGGAPPAEPPLAPQRRSLHQAHLIGSAASALPVPPLPPKHLSQEEWRRMGFRGEFQGTGQLQDALQQRDDSMQDSDAVQGMPRGRGSGKVTKPALSAKRTCTDRARVDHPGSSLPDSASMDDGQPHIPRRKRSRPSEVLAAANAAAKAAAAARAAHEAYVNQTDCTSDPLSSLAAVAAAESASDAELAKSPEQAREQTTHGAASSHRQGAPRCGSEAAHEQGPSHELVGEPLQAHQASPPSALDLAPAGPLEPPTGQAGGEALVGRPVGKRFGSCPELFRGRIGYYAPRLCPSAPFHVQYEDGDSEDLTWQEVLDILV